MPHSHYSELDGFLGDIPEVERPPAFTAFVRSLNGLTGVYRLVDDNGDPLDTDGQDIIVSGGGAGVSQIYIMTSAGVVTSYATAALAKAAAVTGDTIYLLSGTHDIANLGKAGVALRYWLGPNAIISYTGNSSSLIDDSAAGINADLNFTMGGFGTLRTSSSSHKVINLTRAGSSVTIEANILENTYGTLAEAASCVWHENGTLHIRATSLLANGGVAVYWKGGFGVIRAGVIESYLNNAINLYELSLANQHYHIFAGLARGRLVGLQIYGGLSGGNTGGNTNRSWCTIQKIIGGSNGYVHTGSIGYVTSQKIETDVTAFSDGDGIYMTGGKLTLEGNTVLNLTGLPLTIASISTGANPVITTTTEHQLKNGDAIVISGSNSTPSLNGARVVSMPALTGSISPTAFLLASPPTVEVAGTAGTVKRFTPTASSPFFIEGGELSVAASVKAINDAALPSVRFGDAGQSIYCWGCWFNTDTDGVGTVVGSYNLHANLR